MNTANMAGGEDNEYRQDMKEKTDNKATRVPTYKQKDNDKTTQTTSSTLSSSSSSPPFWEYESIHSENVMCMHDHDCIDAEDAKDVISNVPVVSKLGRYIQKMALNMPFPRKEMYGSKYVVKTKPSGNYPWMAAGSSNELQKEADELCCIYDIVEKKCSAAQAYLTDALVLEDDFAFLPEDMVSNEERLKEKGVSNDVYKKFMAVLLRHYNKLNQAKCKCKSLAGCALPMVWLRSMIIKSFRKILFDMHSREETDIFTMGEILSTFTRLYCLLMAIPMLADGGKRLDFDSADSKCTQTTLGLVTQWAKCKVTLFALLYEWNDRYSVPVQRIHSPFLIQCVLGFGNTLHIATKRDEWTLDVRTRIQGAIDKCKNGCDKMHSYPSIWWDPFSSLYMENTIHIRGKYGGKVDHPHNSLMETDFIRRYCHTMGIGSPPGPFTPMEMRKDPFTAPNSLRANCCITGGIYVNFTHNVFHYYRFRQLDSLVSLAADDSPILKSLDKALGQCQCTFYGLMGDESSTGGDDDVFQFSAPDLGLMAVMVDLGEGNTVYRHDMRLDLGKDLRGYKIDSYLTHAAKKELAEQMAELLIAEEELEKMQKECSKKTKKKKTKVKSGGKGGGDSSSAKSVAKEGKVEGARYFGEDDGDNDNARREEDDKEEAGAPLPAPDHLDSDKHMVMQEDDMMLLLYGKRIDGEDQCDGDNGCDDDDDDDTHGWRIVGAHMQGAAGSVKNDDEMVEGADCILCMERACTYCVVPCGHAVYCEVCAENIKHCNLSGMGEKFVDACPTCNAATWAGTHCVPIAMLSQLSSLNVFY